MPNFNRVEIEGHAGKNSELRTSAGGKDIVFFSLATSFGKDDNKKTAWHNIGVSDELYVDTAVEIKKGDAVKVVGSIDYGSYEKDGHTFRTTTIWAREVFIMPRKPKKVGQEPPPGYGPTTSDDDFLPELEEEDVPL
jgi:single-strand DNA-binding protein